MTNILLSYGNNCKDSSAELQIKDLISLYEKIIAPDDDTLVNATKNLRSILKYSLERYRHMKTTLPFFSCSHFDPPQRGIQNFLKAEGLILDFDMKKIVQQDWIQRLKSDERIALGYISPSNMGIKLVFILDEPITNPQTYRELYLKFSIDFSNQYKLADCLDQKNCDVSRISFLCHDPQAWYNPDTIPITVQNWVAPDISDITLQPESSKNNDISDEAYRKILYLLETRPKITKTVRPLIPEISEILQSVADELMIYDIHIQNSESIQYGAKIKLSRDQLQGELNVYYGKEGYKVVSSPRKGTDHELNEVARFIVQSLLDKM